MLKKLCLAVSSLFIMSISWAPAVLAELADCANPKTTVEAIQCGADSSAGVPVGSDPGDTLNNTVANIINIISVVVGIAAVIMMIYGGFRYITSAGNQESVKAAKSTILYALIGLVVVALAQIIVQFVLKEVTNPKSPTPSAKCSSLKDPTAKAACEELERKSGGRQL